MIGARTVDGIDARTRDNGLGLPRELAIDAAANHRE